MTRKIPLDHQRTLAQKSKKTGKKFSFITGAAAALLGGLLSVSLAEAGLLNPTPAKPNIVLIVADDLDATTSEYWERATNAGKDDPLKFTRALIKDKGMTLTEAFSPDPICCPARATILTGKYAHNTGVLTNAGDHGGIEAFNEKGNQYKTIAVKLKDAGYATGLIGKYLNGIADVPGYVPEGWTEFNAFYDAGLESYTGYDYDMGRYNEDIHLARHARITHYGQLPADYSTDVVAEQAVDFIKRRSGPKPFFLYVAATAPHIPLPPAPRHSNHPYSDVSEARVPKSPNYNEANVSDKSHWLTSTKIARSALVRAVNPRDYSQRQGSLYALDELVQKVVRTLLLRGELDNTYIIFVGDNGYNLGSHRLIQKMAPYEESIRVPFVVRGPGIPAGVSRSAMVSLADIAPTISAWAGLPQAEDFDGRSLMEIAGGTTPHDWRTDVLLQYLGPSASAELSGIAQEIPALLWGIDQAVDLPSYRGVRTDKFMYVEFEDELEGEPVKHYELYNLHDDKYQLENLISSPDGMTKHRDTVSDMRSRLSRRSICTGWSCSTN